MMSKHGMITILYMVDCMMYAYSSPQVNELLLSYIFIILLYIISHQGIFGIFQIFQLEF